MFYFSEKITNTLTLPNFGKNQFIDKQIDYYLVYRRNLLNNLTSPKIAFHERIS